MGKILEVKNLTVHIKTHKGVVQAVRGVDFYLNEQETLAVVGESGSGKSITMKGVMGILPKNGKVVEGSVMFQGNDLTKYSERQMQQVRGSEIAMIFQDPMTSLNPVLTVGDQIAESISLHRNLSKAEVKQEVGKLLAKVGIDPRRASEYPHQFSGGMKQRLLLASALLGDPKLLILDEPTAGQDYRHYTEIMEFLKKLNEEYGITIIMITHDMHLMLEYTNRAVVIADGRLLADSAYLKKTSLYDLAVRCGIAEPTQFVERFIGYERQMRAAEREEEA